MRAVIYCRSACALQGVSAQDDPANLRQEQLCREWCAQQLGDVVAVLVESGTVGVRGTSVANFEQSKLGRWIGENPASVDVVVVARFDRISRSTAAVLAFLERLEELGVGVEVVGDRHLTEMNALIHNYVRKHGAALIRNWPSGSAELRPRQETGRGITGPVASQAR